MPVTLADSSGNSTIYKRKNIKIKRKNGLFNGESKWQQAQQTMNDVGNCFKKLSTFSILFWLKFIKLTLKKIVQIFSKNEINLVKRMKIWKIKQNCTGKLEKFLNQAWKEGEFIVIGQNQGSEKMFIHSKGH